MTLANVFEVADAVLYEGYLLYPYRSTSSKNQSRWQFGVLGPEGASGAGFGEECEMHAECLLRSNDAGWITVHLRFLQLQSRHVERTDATAFDGYVFVRELQADDRTFVTWDEAVEQTVVLGPFSLPDLETGKVLPVAIDGSEEMEAIESESGIAGRIIRRRYPLHATVSLHTNLLARDVVRLEIHVANVARSPANRDEATQSSLLSTHLVLEAKDAAFVSLLEPPEDLMNEARSCRNHRCWPVLAGVEGSTDALLISPIILYDYPAVAPESAGSLFDSTEIDEILTLRVLTLTDAEKAEARATDPAAAAIIDRCESMTPEQLQLLHGALRDPQGVSGWNEQTERVDVSEGWAVMSPSPGSDPFAMDVPSFVTPVDGEPRVDDESMPWWDPGVDASVSPTTDVVMIDGCAISKGSSVRLHPSRTADAQDLFFDNELATVMAIFADVDGGTHIAVVIDNDPAADLHEWYGRYLYFAPEEIEPLDVGSKVAPKTC